MLQPLYDITIIGAGPAGATLARLLADQYRILLVDKTPPSGTSAAQGKCCGGLLAPDAQKILARLGLGVPKEILAGPQLFVVRAIDLQSRAERFYQRHYLNLNRRAFDDWLRSLVPPEVVLRLGCTLRRASRVEGGWSLTLSEGRTEFHERARILVGADGAFSSIRRFFFPDAPSPVLYLALQKWLAIPSAPPYFSAFFDPKITDFYAWTIPKDDCLLVGAALRPRDRGKFPPHRRGKTPSLRKTSSKISWEGDPAMPTQAPTKSQWKALFETADRFITEKSWEYVDSNYLFGVRPTSGRTCYCGFFGYYGETYGFSVYLNPRAYFRLQEDRPEEDVFGSLHGIVMFLSPKDELDKEDRRLLAEFGFEPKVRGKWPQFRSLRPGFHPWHLERDEVLLMTTCLGQGIELARRSQVDPDLLAPDRKGRVLVRIAEERDGTVVWSEAREEILVPAAAEKPMEAPLLDELKLRRLAKGRFKREGEWEIDYFYLPAPIQERPGERPYFPVCIVIVEATKGVILGNRLVSHAALHGEMAELVMDTILGCKVMPRLILVAQEEACATLASLARTLGDPGLVQRVKRLKLMEEIRQSLKDFMQGRA